MFQKPPAWKENINIKKIQKGLESEELLSLLRKAQDKYVYWDTFKHYPFPKEFSPKEAWQLLKFTQRSLQETTPVKTEGGESFGFLITKSLYKKLNFIDKHTAGFIRTFSEKPNDSQSEKMLMSGLSEEAIASSQIEGASTTRKAAKEMIYSGRKPKTRDEQMIINNYQVMKKLDEWRGLDLTENMLLDIQTTITKETLDDEGGTGHFRVDGDDIVVSDPLTGETAHTPPEPKKMKKELVRLIAYANLKENESDFVHPVIKATILHFWLAYLHPFIDGNGRTARALFYWYLRKQDYWLFQYLSVSRVIKTSRKKYDNAFLYTESDDNDLTYFLIYIADVTCKAIEDMNEYYEKKVAEEERYKKVAQQFKNLNERQVALISYFSKHSEEEIDIKTHQTKHAVAYQTARTDILSLVGNGYFVEAKRGRKNVFLPNISKLKNMEV